MSLLDRIIEHADRAPDRPSVITYSRQTPTGSLSRAEVVERAETAAAVLRDAGVRHGDTVVLVGTHHLGFYASWLGCVWLGAVPTVLAEPSVRVDRDVYWSRLRALLERIGATALILDPRYGHVAEAARVRVFRYDEILGAPHSACPRAPATARDPLLLQHSSGTTGLHKGVVLSHGNVLAHADAYARVLDPRPDDVIASWLPLYHDMGLVACFLGGLVYGVPKIWLSPFEWVTNPALLLEAVSEHRATMTWLPNFAFHFLAQRARSERAFDLGSLRVVVNCSEPVTRDAIRSFASRFADSGYDGASTHACYAMAETVFAVTSSCEGTPARSRQVDRRAWQESRRTAPSSDGEGSWHVSSGLPLPGCDVRIVSEAGDPVPALTEGRVLVKTPYQFTGYFAQPDVVLTETGHYDTGDLGYVDDDGHLFVTGRRKDIVIVGGRNIHPHDIEAAVSQLADIHPGRAVAFGVGVRGLGTEGLIVLVESSADESRWPDVAQAVRKTVARHLEMDVIDARVVARGRLQKSSSGKLARGTNRDWYLRGEFGPLPPMIDRGELE